MKFLCLAYESQELFDKMSPADWSVLRNDVLSYADALRASGKLLSTNALQSASAAVTVKVRNDALLVMDGPFTEAKEHIGGYFLLEVGSREEAIEIAARWPSARLGTIEVRPIEEALVEGTRYAAHLPR